MQAWTPINQAGRRRIYQGYYDAGAFVGGLIAVFLVSRVVLWALTRPGDNEQRIVVAHVITLAIVVALGGYGFAEGGSPQFELALKRYILPVAFWLVVDLIRLKGRRASREP